MSTTTEYVTVGHVDDVPPGQVRLVVVDGRAWAVANVDGSFFAVDNNCPHNGGPLGYGALAGRELTCPWHGWRWDVASGANTWPGTRWRAMRVPVRVVGDRVQLPRI